MSFMTPLVTYIFLVRVKPGSVNQSQTKVILKYLPSKIMMIMIIIIIIIKETYYSGIESQVC